MPFDPTQLAQLGAGATFVLAIVASLFAIGKIGPMTLVDRAEKRADTATALAASALADLKTMATAVDALTTELRESRLRGNR